MLACDEYEYVAWSHRKVVCPCFHVVVQGVSSNMMVPSAMRFVLFYMMAHDGARRLVPRAWLLVQHPDEV